VSKDATMRHRGMYIDGVRVRLCLLFICVELHLAGVTESVRASKGAMIHRRGMYIDGVRVCLLTDYLCRPPPGRGYGERASEQGRYDTPSGYVHRWGVRVRLYLLIICVDLHLARGTESVRASKGATIRRQGMCMDGILSVGVADVLIHVDPRLAEVIRVNSPINRVMGLAAKTRRVTA